MKQRVGFLSGFFVAGLFAVAIIIKIFAPASASAEGSPGASNDEVMIERGRYLVKIAGCNDCHTPNYMVTPDDVQEEDYLIGVPVGWFGPWGTTYASNLRITVEDFPEDVWVQILKTRKAMPPMPWVNVNALTEADSRAMYRYIKSLGVNGERMPPILSPGEMPQTPYFDFHIKGLPEG
ncbi:MAG TPA: cytochrome C [Kiritimatiellia bacterium]|nr:cytochrome C [Kiritimatiellia bacterium]